MALQLSTAQVQFSRYKKDISDVSAELFLDWCNFIAQFVYRELWNRDPERWIATQTYTISTTPQTESLPNDFVTIQPFGCGVYLVDNSGADTVQTLARTGFGSSQMGFYITGNNIVFTQAQNNSYTLRYMPQRTEFTSTGDYFTLDGTANGEELIPEFYSQYVLRALDALYQSWDEQIGAEAVSDQRFIRVLNDLLDNIRKEPEVYGLGDYSIYY